MAEELARVRSDWTMGHGRERMSWNERVVDGLQASLEGASRQAVQMGQQAWKASRVVRAYRRALWTTRSFYGLGE